MEKSLLRKVGEAIGRFPMIQEGDRVAVGLSGGKDSVTLLEALRLLQARAPISFSLCAFTVEQGKFLAPVRPVGEFFQSRGVEWHYYEDSASFELLEKEPDHGCDRCSRFRRRAVYDIARQLGANVIALGHTADDFCESLLRNALFNGKLSALPPVTWSSRKDFRLIRPLVFVPEEITRSYAREIGAPVVPCGCSQKTGTVRSSLRGMFHQLEQENPRIRESLLGAMGNLDPSRLLDPRYFDFAAGVPEPTPAEGQDFPILQPEPVSIG